MTPVFRRGWQIRRQAMLALLLGSVPFGVPAGTDSPDGLFTGQQVVRGEELYGRLCAGCHGAKLEGASASSLADHRFLTHWSRYGQTLADLYYVVRTNMPLGQGGSLSADEYIDLVAFMLARNGYQPGPKALTPDSELLESTPVGNEGSRTLAETGDAPCPDEPFFDASAVPSAAGPSQAELDRAGEQSDDWLLPDRDYSGTRYAPLDRITPGNVGQLRRICTFDTGEDTAFQTYPLAHDGRLYFTTNHATYAVDATSCTEIWRHERAQRCAELWGRSRGVALKDGYVVRGTPDGYLLALNARTGQRIWERRISESDRGGGAVSMPPLVYEDRIIMGPSPAEAGLKGWIAAFALKDGESLWKFHTVPETGDAAAATWGGAKGLERGGGGVWTPFTLDAATGTVYIPVGNPSPAYYTDSRPGANLYTNSLVALDARNGRIRWHYQILEADYHDWDLNHAGPLLSVAGQDGKTIDGVIVVGKDGMLHLLDRKTHELRYRIPVVSQQGRELELSVEQDVHFCPGLYGGVQWNGVAHHPGTGAIYVPAVEWCGSLRKTDEARYIPGSFFIGGIFRMDAPETAFGHLSAFDAADGGLRWRYRSKLPMLAAVTATSSGLLFSGELTGDLLAIDAESGEVLWRESTGVPLGAGIITYAHRGRQYLAVAAGNPSPLWPAGPGSARMIVYSLPP